MLTFVTEFFLYSFLGFLLEVVYARLINLPKRGRKCLLLLPLCPVYGLGALAILHMPPLLLRHPVSVFAAGGLLATLVEFSVGFLYEVGAGVRFWDYTHQPGNLGGRICPLYTLFWGILSLVLVYGLDPLLGPLTALTPAWVPLTLFLVFAADAPFSLWLLYQTGTTASLRWGYWMPRPRNAM